MNGQFQPRAVPRGGAPGTPEAVEFRPTELSGVSGLRFRNSCRQESKTMGWATGILES